MYIPGITWADVNGFVWSLITSLDDDTAIQALEPMDAHVLPGLVFHEPAAMQELSTPPHAGRSSVGALHPDKQPLLVYAPLFRCILNRHAVNLS